MVHLIGCLLLAFRGAHLIIIVLLPPHIGDAHQMLEYDEEMQTDVMAKTRSMKKYCKNSSAPSSPKMKYVVVGTGVRVCVRVCVCTCVRVVYN